MFSLICSQIDDVNIVQEKLYGCVCMRERQIVFTKRVDFLITGYQMTSFYDFVLTSRQFVDPVRSSASVT